MKAWILNSCLAAQIAAFIDLRRLSGTDYHSQAQLLSYFDHFLVEHRFSQAANRHGNITSALP